jgi:hypothetical protein
MSSWNNRGLAHRIKNVHPTTLVGVISNIPQQRRIVAVLANSPSFTHNSQISGFGGNHVCGPVEEIPVQFVARSGVLGFDVACGERGIHPRTAGGLQRRCVSSLQRGHSRRRPRHGLHGPQAGSTLAWLPVVFQTARARTRGQGGSASQHQAGGFAKARQRERVSVKTTPKRPARHGLT